MDRLNQSVRTTLLGLTANLVLATGKLVAGIAGHSHALIADATESFADLASSLVVWRGLVVSAQPADEEHPYGHGKAEAIATAFVSAMLLIAAVWIAVQSIHEIVTPHQSPAPFTLVVLLVVILVKESLFRFALRQAGQLESTAINADAWHHRSDAITSAAAFVGIGIAVVGGRGYETADDYAALFAAVIIGWNGWRLLQPALDELMDRMPDPALTQQIRTLATQVPGVDGIEKCLVRKMGYNFLVDMHVEVDPEMTVRQAHEVAHRVKDRIREALPAVHDVLVHIEPSS